MSSAAKEQRLPSGPQADRGVLQQCELGRSYVHVLRYDAADGTELASQCLRYAEGYGEMRCIPAFSRDGAMMAVSLAIHDPVLRMRLHRTLVYDCGLSALFVGELWGAREATAGVQSDEPKQPMRAVWAPDGTALVWRGGVARQLGGAWDTLVLGSKTMRSRGMCIDPSSQVVACTDVSEGAASARFFAVESGAELINIPGSKFLAFLSRPAGCQAVVSAQGSDASVCQIWHIAANSAVCLGKVDFSPCTPSALILFGSTIAVEKVPRAEDGSSQPRLLFSSFHTGRKACQTMQLFREAGLTGLAWQLSETLSADS
ncbi:hypothetical protein WJX73_001069 [Symbiochloris irregularis]|uniref:Uncharacterized protein n=1 Tax=Symbiochloris irregularis TaxID=706552 RepID=A0AAW1PV09_9CHLO